MSILVVENLTKYFGAQDVFSSISFQVAHGDKIALVGVNGAGKTTLLHLIVGLDTPTTGKLSISKGLRIGYLSQAADLSTGRTLYQEMLDVFADLRVQQAQLHQLEAEMASPERADKALERYGELLQRFELAGGYTYEQEIKRVLKGLGLNETDWDKPLAHLSGGQRTRAQLAQLLLQDLDLLLLDEPTNNLDLQATEWLEGYLNEWKGSLIVVAHDRYFLDKVVNRVWEMGFGTLEQYKGNYSQYVQERAARMARRQAEYEAQQEQIARTEEFIRRYGAGQRSKEARGRETRLERMERLQKPQEHKAMKFRLAAKARGGNNVLMTHGLITGYERPLIRFPELLLLRHERAALLGPNGCGKTTFLKTIVGEVPALGGEVRIGNSIQVTYFAQGHENLRDNATILDEILRIKNLPLEQARGFLGRFLFSGDDVFKPVSCLSGGERGRVALAMLALQGANLLLLDEPTNHLDIASQELLEQVLNDFDGTILFVSHDRYFIDAVATQVWAVENDQIRVYVGNYSEYLRQRAEPQETKEPGETTVKKRPFTDRSVELERRREQRQARELQNKRTELETEIQRLETHLSVLASDLERASQAQRVDRVHDLGREYASVQEQLQRSLEEWARAAEV